MSNVAYWEYEGNEAVLYDAKHNELDRVNLDQLVDDFLFLED